MLYKKYHRNFVKQFRIGTKVNLGIQTETAITDPFVGLTLSGRHDVSIETDKHTIAPLVYWSGRLVKIYVV